MKEQENIQEKNNYIAQSLTGILDIIICLLLFISSIYKGAFYKSDFIFSNAIISIIGIIYLVYKVIKEIISKEKDIRSRSKVRVLLDMFMLILPFTYALPILFKTFVSLPDSVFEMLRYVNMTVIYFISRNTKVENVYMNIFVLIAIVQSILGIDQLSFRNLEGFLNNISTGYLPDTDRLSGTLQYANITGIVILLGLIICFSNLSSVLEKKSKFVYLKLGICISLILLQSTAIVLTKSRIAVVAMLLMFFVDIIFNFVYTNKKIGIFKIILVIYGLFVSSIIENLIMDNKYSKIYLMLTLCSLIIVISYGLFNILVKILRKKIQKTKLYEVLRTFNKRKIKYIIIVAFVMLIGILLFVPNNLIVTNNTKGTIQIERSIYDFREGKNSLKIALKTLKEDTRYTIEICGLKSDFGVEQLAVFNYYDKTKDVFEKEIDIPDNIRKLNIYIRLQKGSLRVNEFEMNGKDTILSYMFIPDNIIFKIKDTFFGVYGDSLRLEYVKDSLKLFKKNPIVGVGGEGFKHTYGSVQEFGYISSEAHSAVLQSLVETGIIGTCILFGIICLSFVIIVKMFIRFKKIDINDKNHIICLVSIYMAMLFVVIFDLAFSYAFMIYEFGIIVALLGEKYIDILSKYKERKEKISKIDWSYIKIAILSISFVCLSITSYFSINALRASLIRVPNKGEKLNVLEIAENIGYLELKVKQDMFDMDYIRELNEEYVKYKTLVTRGYVNTSNDDKTREELKNELNNLTNKIKLNADKMLEYEYYDKYVLKDVADIYIENYITFAEIYKNQFESEEVAYDFYLNYAVKLTDRIKQLNPYSARANELYVNMSKKYIEELESDNRYLNSESVRKAIKKFEEKI